MKKMTAMLALALCVCLLAGCGGQDAPDAAATEAPADDPASVTDAEAPAEEASATDAAPEAEPAATEVPEEPASDTDAETAEGPSFLELEAEQCVEDALDQPGVLPRVVLDCPGAEEINRRILDAHSANAKDPIWNVHYEVYKGAGRFLSVLVAEQVNDSVFYTPYNLDLATGETITGGEMLALLEVDPADLARRELETLENEFIYQFGSVQDQMDQAFFDGQLARTTAPENAETERIWFGYDGQLFFAGRIYGIAGAEYYEYPLGTGLYFA